MRDGGDDENVDDVDEFVSFQLDCRAKKKIKFYRFLKPFGEAFSRWLYERRFSTVLQ